MKDLNYLRENSARRRLIDVKGEESVMGEAGTRKFGPFEKFSCVCEKQSFNIIIVLRSDT